MITPLLTLMLGCSDKPLPTRAEGPDGDPPAASEPTSRDDHATSPYDPPTQASDPGTADCPPEFVCVDAFPFVHDGTTVGGTAAFEAYSCAPQIDESGPETVYRVTVAERGFLAASLSGLDAGADIDVHVLATLDPEDCIDRGHWEGATWVEPGTYWVVADTWTTLEGAYTLSFALTTPAAIPALDADALGRALWAFDRTWKDEDATRLRLAVADFDRPSDEPRLWVVDLATAAVLFEEWVSHGEGSSDPADAAIVAEMSNIDGSHMSSVGVMAASETYEGSHGYSMRFDGLEPGFTDAARARAIVMHNADYATEAFVDDYGYLGESWGCTVVDPAISADVIDALADGGIFVSHFTDPAWLAESAYVSDF